MKTYKFQGNNIKLRMGTYPNGRTALEFTDESGELYLTATENIPEECLGLTEICIKTWGGNEGVLDFLIKQGIVSGSKRNFRVGAGFAIVHVVELLKTDF